ncbi:MAG: glycoside hydrolase family 57 protein [candidate division NC10 bacterium]|nr:glycoside hydrolase family 57 protein [candidate division NC10 bacterium]
MAKSDPPFYVALLWHFHQPFYKDLATGEYWMPWVRLHAIKDYHRMASLARGFPGLHLNFNLVPSLVEQLEDYAHQGATDRALHLAAKPAKDLNPSEEVSILSQFFSANWETMIQPYPRYRELLEKRGRTTDPQREMDARRYFSHQDFLDLQVWFNLVWFNSALRKSDPFLRELVRKGRNFSEEEKLLLLERQREIIREILPLYKSLLQEGQIETTTSPYYHPILPLLCDTEIAKESSPDIVLPRHRFRHPEDALAQIRLAQESHLRHLGVAARGMWPSEGGVSQEMADLVASAGIQWIASDEEILFRSLGLPLRREDRARQKEPGLLYQPFSLRAAGGRLHLLFRDHFLSDLIGFTYARWDPKQAASDLLRSLHQIKDSLRNLPGEGPFLVSIILDGENAWEYFQDDGNDFLSFLYEGLMSGEELTTVKISDFLERYPPRREIARLASGSWINHNFRIWIGHEEDNAAWDFLAQTREDLVALERLEPTASGTKGKEGRNRDPRNAWREIYIAEGSDWCWWYGDDHSSGMDEEFDALFRKHLINVYGFMGVEVPPHLYLPLLRERARASLSLESADLMNPTIDGRLTNYFEWLPAGFYDPCKMGDAMHHGNPQIKGIYAGFNLEKMFIRVDVEEELLEGDASDGTFLRLSFLSPSLVQVELQLDPAADRPCIRIFEVEEGGVEGASPKEQGAKGLEAAAERMIELAISLKALKAGAGDEIKFMVVLGTKGRERERWPRSGYLSARVPSEELVSNFWQA